MELATRTSPVLPGAHRAVRALAREVIALAGSSRLPTTHDLQAVIGVGAGTVQKAFSILEDLGALTTQSRGHQGRFVEHRNLAQLWSLAELAQVRVFVTPPGAREIYALLEALVHQFDQIGLTLEISYVRGGEARLNEAVRAETGFAVVSAGAAQSYVNDRRKDLQTRALASGTYYAPGSVVVLTRDGVDPYAASTRIGVDQASHDHRTITEAEFGALDEGRVKPVPFPSVPAAILRGEVDAGVWHRMLLLISPELAGLCVLPLSASTVDEMEPLTRAVVAHRTDNPYLAALFQVISWEKVARVQTEVMSGLSLWSEETWYQ